MQVLKWRAWDFLRKTNEDSLNVQDDYGVSFSEQQYTHGSCYISLFKYESF